MAFQISDKNGKPITMGNLDHEAAEFWNVGENKKFYASPNEYHINWFDSIGYTIHRGECHFTSGWDNIKCEMFRNQMEAYGHLSIKEQQEGLAKTQEYLGPYFDLIDHWKSKGYQPIKIQE